MDLQAYLDRIGFQGAPRPDHATLKELHRRHLQAIPYENYDVLLGRPLTPDPEAAFDKLVTRRRGGWCYEMNGLLGAALEAIGFRVTRMAGGVMRVALGDQQVGNHLVLRVDLDEPYIADVGFGDGVLEPIPLRAGEHQVAGYDFRLEPMDENWWRFHNHALGGAASFDFRLEPADPALLAERCQDLQTQPDSHFRQNSFTMRHTPDGLLQLRGRVLRKIRPGWHEDRVLASADELVSVLAHDFDLDLPEVASLWPEICQRHDALFAQATTA